MTERVLLVDFENVQKIDLAALPGDVRVLLVLGDKQSKLPTELVLEAAKLGDRFHYVPIAGRAPNAVDFCVAFYLGERLTKHPGAECVVLSKDKKGFDPLVEHLVKERGLRVRRVNSQKEAFPAAGSKSPTQDPYARTLELLKKEKHRPGKQAGLEGKIKCYFPKMGPEERKAMVERLVKEGKVTGAAGKIEYAL